MIAKYPAKCYTISRNGVYTLSLSLNLIRENLPPQLHAEMMGDSWRKMKLSRPKLYGTSGESTYEQFYVTRTCFFEEADIIKSSCLACVGKGDVRGLLHRDCSVLYFPDTEDYISVFNQICAVFDKFEQWENTLRDQLEREDGFDYHDLALTAASVLDNTVGLSDQFLHISFTTEHLADGSLRISEDKFGKEVPIAVNEHITATCEKEKQLHVPYLSAFAYQRELAPYCCNMFPLGHFVGCSFIFPDRHPFRESDYEIANVFFGYFSKAFTKYIRTYANQESTSVRAMQQLLSGLPLSKSERQMFSLQPDEAWVLFRLRACPDAHAMPKEYVHAIICSLMPKIAFTGIEGDKITGILKKRKDMPIKESSNFASFRNILLHTGYYAGISNEFSSITRLSEYRFQADYALGFAENHTNRCVEYTLFNDCVLDYMLSACCTNLSLDTLFSRQFSNLLEYDRTHGTFLCKTLECYLKNETNISETARELYLHRSSLLKRLDRIKLILECDLTKPNLNLYYRMCFELLRRTQRDI
jgi:hypothetical protein